VIAAVVVAACSSSAPVDVEEAIEIEAPAESSGSVGEAQSDHVPESTPSSTEPDPSTTEAPTTSPVTTEPDPTATLPELRPPALGVDDELFPALGSSDLDVESYLVVLDATDPTEGGSGTIEMLASVAPELDSIAIDSNGPVIESVSVDGTETPFELVDGELIVDTSTAQTADGEAVISIDFSFDANGTRSDVGLPIGWIPTADGAYVLNEPDGSARWLPSNDHPSDKATWRWEITVADGHVASANGALVSRPRPGLGGTWVWEENDPMPTYLVHLVVGDYEVFEGDSVSSVDGRSIPLTHLVPAGELDRFADDIEPTADQLAFFEELFGPYPLERYGLAFVRELSGLAMETQGRSLFGASDFDQRSVDYIQHLLLSHELAHQWFGNAVSPSTWDALWLNEALTTYAQWLWLDEIELQPLDRWAEQQLDLRLGGSLDATGDPLLGNLFGFERYDGGAVVVHALRLTLGDDAFFDLLRRWVDENGGTSRSTDDFIELAEEMQGADLTEFFDAWLFAVDLPPEYPG